MLSATNGFMIGFLLVGYALNKLLGKWYDSKSLPKIYKDAKPAEITMALTSKNYFELPTEFYEKLDDGADKNKLNYKYISIFETWYQKQVNPSSNTDLTTIKDRILNRYFTKRNARLGQFVLYSPDNDLLEIFPDDTDVMNTTRRDLKQMDDLPASTYEVPPPGALDWIPGNGFTNYTSYLSAAQQVKPPARQESINEDRYSGRRSGIVNQSAIDQVNTWKSTRQKYVEGLKKIHTDDIKMFKELYERQKKDLLAKPKKHGIYETLKGKGNNLEKFNKEFIRIFNDGTPIHRLDSGRKEFISKLINTDEYDKYCNWMNTDSPVYIYVRLILTRTELYKILIDELNAGWDGQSVDLLNINKE